MEQIEKATGRQIIRIETNDLDEMEDVSLLSMPLFRYLCYEFGLSNSARFGDTANEESAQIDHHEERRCVLFVWCSL